MTKKTEVKEKLSDTYVIEAKDKTKLEVFMSYGVLTLLTSYVPKIEQAATIMTNSDLQRIYAQILLAPKDEKGQPDVQKVDLNNDHYSLDAILDLVTWGVDHVISFLFKSLTAQAEVMTKHVDTMNRYAQKDQALASLMSTPNGSEA